MKILFDEQKKKKGMTVQIAGLDYTLAAGQEVVLSAGAFQSPRLLMLSSVGPESTPQEHGISCLSNVPEVAQNM